MPSILVTTRSGETHELEATPGLSVMEIAREGGIDEIQALCGGCCSCATCHVYLDPAFAEKVPPLGSDEDDLLDATDHRQPGSRLACQLPFSPALDRLHVTVAPE